MAVDDIINENWTVGELEEEFEGEPYRSADEEKDHYICDFCSKGVHYKSEPRARFYIADKVLNPDHPVWQQVQRSGGEAIVPLAAYCEDCVSRLLLFPCEGFAEVRVKFDLDEERVMKNVEVTDVSPRDDGIPWEPKELTEKITQVPWEENRLMSVAAGDDHLWGPENMVTFYMSAVNGVDIRELVNWDGTVDPKKLGQARKKYDQFMEEVSKRGADRMSFRKMVEGN